MSAEASILPMALPNPPKLLPVTAVDLIRFCCPLCSTILEIPRSSEGSTGPCPVCAATIIAPTVVKPVQRERTGIAIQQIPVTDESLEAPEPPVHSAVASTTQLPRMPSAIPSGHGPRRRRRHEMHPVLQWVYNERWFLMLLILVVGSGVAFVIFSGR